jgi:GntR family transcriptional regulator
MLCSINPKSDIPIYEQIVRQVKFAIARGSLRPGAMVESVRELAKRIVVNHNTVARAYRELQAAGILETVRGQGLRVSMRSVKRCVAERRELIRERLRQVLAEASQSQLSRDELASILEEMIERYVPLEESS